MKKIKVVAEIANYWHGDEEQLFATIEAAAAAQVDFLKVQLFNPDRIGNPWKHKKKCIEACLIKETLLKEVKRKCDRYGIGLIGTVNNADRVELLQNTDVTNIKIASGQLHPQLIDAIIQHQWERIFVSTGMIAAHEDLGPIRKLKENTNELVIMHCVSLYPTHDPELNLNRIIRLREEFVEPNDQCKTVIGYSDHHMDDLPGLLAVGLGAEYVERHFKIEGSFGPTSEIALSPEDMGNFVGLCKRMSIMFGAGNMAMQPREQDSYEHYKTRFVI